MPRQVVRLAAYLVHDIENPDDRPARGLHVHGGDLATRARRMWDPGTGAPRAFDFEVFEQ